TAEKRVQHVLTRNLLADLMVSNDGKGMALALNKLFGHISEQNAQKGIVNIAIEGRTFHSIDDIAKEIKLQVSTQGGDYLKGTKYEGQEERVLRKMQQILISSKREAAKEKKQPPPTPPPPSEEESDAAINDIPGVT
ncbi:MAG: hypothetical protein COX82_02745, partial [Candidatus Magasanikbacteria bacterium CG_4_10_14_0_2_um_filter_41_10]